MRLLLERLNDWYFPWPIRSQKRKPLGIPEKVYGTLGHGKTRYCGDRPERV